MVYLFQSYNLRDISLESFNPSYEILQDITLVLLFFKNTCNL